MNFPNLPLFNEKMIAIFLSCEEGCWMLIGFFVSLVAIGIWKLRVTSFLSVGIMANGQICSSSKGRTKIERVKYCTFFIYKGHFLFERKWKKEGIFSHICMESVCSRFPGNWGESSDDLAELCLHQNQGIGLSIAKLMKLLDWKIMLAGSEKKMRTFDMFMLKQLSQKQTFFPSVDQFAII